MPVKPSAAVPPGESGFVNTKRLLSVGEDGCARGSTPGCVKTLWIEFRPALIAPWSGFCWYMIRQITPTAKSETARGMKRTILKKLAQAIFSVRTASTSPKSVTDSGATAIQITLFLIAVWMMESANSVW